MKRWVHIDSVDSTPYQQEGWDTVGITRTQYMQYPKSMASYGVIAWGSFHPVFLDPDHVVRAEAYGRRYR
jgi:hypothetical protein